MKTNCGTCRHAVWARTPSGRIKKNVAGFCGISKKAADRLTELVSIAKLPGSMREDLDKLFDSYSRWQIWVWPEAHADCEAWEPKDA